MGPTAAGKTALALELHARLPVEIISVDAAQVYRHMDIGTAKPDPELLARVPHRLIDICDPAESYSAARFRRDALAAMAEIHAAGRVPLLVGGSHFYFRVLRFGLPRLPGADPALREGLEREAGKLGWPALHARLAERDPQRAARIDPNDRQRIARALEVVLLTGDTSPAVKTVEDSPWDFVSVALAPAARSVLHERIATRFREMLRLGLVEEVAALRARGDLHPDLPALRCVGYLQTWRYLAGELSEAAMVEQAISATRQLAKRQLTWLRGEAGLVWLDSSSVKTPVALLEFLLERTHIKPSSAL
ncbi:MAG: tRNA (adenosine(37)-N6)-dimethylallyltransferase MiaA [Gammaproteobacteria bacterium]|jgi:tRNA dimethylallyltransferase|nr:tRNA (adenosine(37)-N6)-dimethylallyltransferase MiaA [Gammaproteobacteria bacterium]